MNEMGVWGVLAVVVVGLLLVIIRRWHNCPNQGQRVLEHFATDQTIVPNPRPAPLSWDFESPKSNIKNFNETTDIHQDLNPLEASGSVRIGLNQPVPDRINTYMHLNRQFDHLLLQNSVAIERDFNRGFRIENRPQQDWLESLRYPYQRGSWDGVSEPIRTIVLDAIKALNVRMSINMLGVRDDPIQYYWVTPTEVALIVLVYKTFTACDIEYDIGLDPNINENLQMNFERPMLIQIDNLHQDAHGELSYHLKYLRFPLIDYDAGNPLDEMPYLPLRSRAGPASRGAGPANDYFYLSLSRQPEYQMHSNTTNRSQYLRGIDQLILDRQKPYPFQCFGAKTFNQQKLRRTDDRSRCEDANGIWDRRCQGDEECPYYQSNRNYPNRLGGCQQHNGFCQLPAGLIAQTFHQPLNPQTALCYNCRQGLLGPGTIGACCREQLDSRLYPHLRSPDYYFHGDNQARMQAREDLQRQDLHWSQYAGSGPNNWFASDGPPVLPPPTPQEAK